MNPYEFENMRMKISLFLAEGIKKVVCIFV